MSEVVLIKAQLDAAKQMYNDKSNLCLQLYTNINLKNGELDLSNMKIEALNAEVAVLKASLAEKDSEIKNCNDMISE